LTNNTSEKDIRDQAKKRKISAGTRSDDGRKARDTFMSLQKTCKKLGISFRDYLTDRLAKEHKIPDLAQLIRIKAGIAYSTYRLLRTYYLIYIPSASTGKKSWGKPFRISMMRPLQTPHYQPILKLD